MANSLCFAPACSIKSPPSIRKFVENSAVVGRVLTVKEWSCSIGSSKFPSLEVKAAPDTNPTTKKTSLVCAECDGNGAKVCTQCNGTGVNSVDHFNGQFKAGGLCWLCRNSEPSSDELAALSIRIILALVSYFRLQRQKGNLVRELQRGRLHRWIYEYSR